MNRSPSAADYLIRDGMTKAEIAEIRDWSMRLSPHDRHAIKELSKKQSKPLVPARKSTK